MVKLGTNVLDEVRRRVQQDTLSRRGHKDDPLYKIRGLLRRGREHLSDKQIARLNAGLTGGDPGFEVTVAWHAYQQLRSIYQATTPAEGRRLAEHVIASFPTCPIPEVARLGRTLRTWRQHVLARFDEAAGRVSNGGTEAINLIIEKTRRLAPWTQPVVATPLSVTTGRVHDMPGPRLSEQERYRIEAMWVAGLTFPQIAGELGRDRSTIWREVRRNHSHHHGVKHCGLTQKQARRVSGHSVRGLYRWGYHAVRADERARTRARRPRQVKLGFAAHTTGAGWGKGFARGLPTPLRTIVVSKLAVRWSPEQIASWLADNFAGYPELQVSHETIYQALYVQSRGALREELTNQVALRSGRARRRPRTEVAGPIRSRRPWTAGFNISTRPPQATDRAVPGHWEGTWSSEPAVPAP